MSVRRIALAALLDITERGAYANLRLKEAQHDAPTPVDARWITAAVYETLDHLLYLDHMLAAFCKGTIKPVVRGVLRMGACQMLCMRVPPNAACNESVKLIKEVGKGALSGYVNGVMRALARAMEAGTLPPLPQAPPALRMSVQYSWPQWITEAWIAAYGEEMAERMLQSAPPTNTSIRPHAPYTMAELTQALQLRGIEHRPGRWADDCVYLQGGMDFAHDPLFLEGHVAVQGESAMLACRACGVQPGMRVLDACAAPGGKSAYLYALSKGEIELHAWELHPHRKTLMDETFKRLNVQANTCVQDATLPVPAYAEQFDVVLVDAPCSGLGVAKPDVRYAKCASDIQALSRTQARILHACAAYVKPSGALVYATCTIGRQENEDQIAAFLASHTSFAMDSLVSLLPEGLPGLHSGMIQLLPFREGLEGFFIARLKRGKA